MSLIGVPMWTHLTKIPVDEIINSYIFIKLSDPSNSELRAEIIDSLTKSLKQNGAKDISVVDEFEKTLQS